MIVAHNERMPDTEFLGDRRRAHEEEYFHKREQELIAKLQQRARDANARQHMAERSGVADAEMLSMLDGLGYTPETVMLLHLAPLLEVAWAEGGVSDRERALIVEAARTRGVEPGSPADVQLAAWLSTRPSADFFDKALRLVQAILQTQTEDEREAAERDLLTRSATIASASGGILGYGKVSPDELAVLERISNELAVGRAAPPSAPPR